MDKSKAEDTSHPLVRGSAESEHVLAHNLTERQRRELNYHQRFAAEQASLAQQPVSMDVVAPSRRRWWNAYWSMYNHILAAKVAGKRVAVPGCGLGEDALRLSRLGARVSAFDISPDLIDVAIRRATFLGASAIEFDVMAAEMMTYPDAYFDAVVLVNVLHHVDIAATMREVRRVLGPSGVVIGTEMYTHSALQRVRDGVLITKHVYPKMRRWIYGNDSPYITEDERKLDQHELQSVLDSMSNCDVDYFGMLQGRLFPDRIVWAAQIDRLIMRAVGRGASMLAGRVVFRGDIGSLEANRGKLCNGSAMSRACQIESLATSTRSWP